MVDQLNFAPCGYLIIERDGKIQAMNHTLKTMLGNEQEVDHIHNLLTTPSRLYYQTYFLPLLDVKGKVNEIYLTFKSKAGRMPVLMNAGERLVNGKKQIECVVMAMKVRDEYESELIQEKRNLKRTLKETDEANKKLQQVLTDVEEKKRELSELNEQLEHLVLTDGLTEIANRRHFDKKLTSLLKNEENVFSLALLDVDFFKKVNDQFGHQVGDLVLQELSLKLQRVVIDEGFVARIGGEEFAILYPQTTEEIAYEKAEKLRQTIEQSTWLHTPITISVGVAAVIISDTEASLLKRADEALYESKRSGRNRVSRLLPNKIDSI